MPYRHDMKNILKVLFCEWSDNNDICIKLSSTDGGLHVIGFNNRLRQSQELGGGMTWCLETTCWSMGQEQPQTIMSVCPYRMSLDDLLVDVSDYVNAYGALFEDKRVDDCIRYYEVFHATYTRIMELEWDVAKIVSFETGMALSKYAKYTVAGCANALKGVSRDTERRMNYITS